MSAEVEHLRNGLDALLITAKANADAARARDTVVSRHELRRWEAVIVAAKRIRKGADERARAAAEASS